MGRIRPRSPTPTKSPELQNSTEPIRSFGCPSQTNRPNQIPAPRRTLTLSTLVQQSQLFSQSYESILPTSLAYILRLDESFLSFGTCCGDGYGDRANENQSGFYTSPILLFPFLFMGRSMRIKQSQDASALPPFDLLLAMTAFHRPLQPHCVPMLPSRRSDTAQQREFVRKENSY